MKTQVFKAVLFDFDGVLTTHEYGSQSICSYVCEAAGVDRNVFEREYRRYNAKLLTGELTHEEIWGDVCGAVGESIDISVLYDSFVNTPINAGMLELAFKLKRKNLKIGMVTDNKADRIRSIVEHHNWNSFFDGIAVSADVGSGKRQEEIFHKIFQMLDVRPEECVFIDNNIENLAVPQRLGVSVIFFDFNANDVAELEKNLLKLGMQI
jgi:haloacid dehalogenase superfamily, subfamily IA, variant 3 with third motif having DD or ED